MSKEVSEIIEFNSKQRKTSCHEMCGTYFKNKTNYVLDYFRYKLENVVWAGTRPVLSNLAGIGAKPIPASMEQFFQSGACAVLS